MSQISTGWTEWWHRSRRVSRVRKVLAKAVPAVVVIAIAGGADAEVALAAGPEVTGAAILVVAAVADAGSPSVQRSR
jgi:PP-loop superfamily ATP-utilizing enzyme